MISIVAIVISFWVGYCLARIQEAKKKEVIRLMAINDFIYSFCEILRDRCEKILQNISSLKEQGNLYCETDDQKRLPIMLSILSNVHDELAEIWNNHLKEKLTQLQPNSEKEVTR